MWLIFVMELFSQYSEFTFFGNSLQQYLITLVVLVVAFVVFKVVVLAAIAYLTRLADRTSTHLDNILIDTLQKVQWIIYLMLSLFIVELLLQFPMWVLEWLDNVFVVFWTYLGVRGINAVVHYAADAVGSKKGPGKESIFIFAGIAKASVWAFGLVFLISAFGYNISSLVAGLGIGGIAIALAVQNVLGDLFSSVSIYIDKPFIVGDFIMVGDKMGTVAKIGLKTTRVISMAGEELVIPNTTLTGREIQNFGRVKKRRGVITIGVTYSTPVKKMEEIPGIVKNIIESYEDCEWDRGHFKSYGAFSKDFEFVYYVATKEYAYFLERNQTVLLEIQKAFEKKNIEFAFPTQTIHVSQ
jgi:small-conductance mechanosensitive channel